MSKKSGDPESLIIAGVSMLFGGLIVTGVYFVCGPEVALFGDALVCHGEWRMHNS